MVRSGERDGREDLHGRVEDRGVAERNVSSGERDMFV